MTNRGTHHVLENVKDAGSWLTLSATWILTGGMQVILPMNLITVDCERLGESILSCLPSSQILIPSNLVGPSETSTGHEGESTAQIGCLILPTVEEFLVCARAVAVEVEEAVRDPVY